MDAKPVSASHTVMTEFVMPNDTNPLGDLMGGNLMRWMDMAAGICAARHCETYCVTASVDHVSFRRPIRIGNVITINASVTRAFNTSIEIFLEVHTGNPTQRERHISNHAYMTFVAMDETTHRPKPVPKVLPKTDREKRLFDGAVRRREIRLVLSGRMPAKEALEIKALFEDLGDTV